MQILKKEKKRKRKKIVKPFLPILVEDSIDVIYVEMFTKSWLDSSCVLQVVGYSATLLWGPWAKTDLFQNLMRNKKIFHQYIMLFQALYCLNTNNLTGSL